MQLINPFVWAVNYSNSIQERKGFTEEKVGWDNLYPFLTSFRPGLDQEIHVQLCFMKRWSLSRRVISNMAALDVFVPGAETSSLATVMLSWWSLYVFVWKNVTLAVYRTIKSNFKFECQDVWDFAGQNQHEATIWKLEQGLSDINHSSGYRLLEHFLWKVWWTNCLSMEVETFQAHKHGVCNF